MKKFAILLVAILLSFALTACCCMELPDNDTDTSPYYSDYDFATYDPSTDITESTDASDETPTSSIQSTPNTVESSVSSNQSTVSSQTQPPVQAFDYSALCGTYYDSVPVSPSGPSYFVIIDKIDNNTKSIEFSISYVGYNLSPLYETETIRTTIASDNTVQFNWSDSWGNKGNGTLVLNPNDTSSIKILVNITEDAGGNRATLSTFGEYKTLTRE